MKRSYIYLIIFTIILYFLPPFIEISTQPKPKIKFSLPHIRLYDNGVYLVTLNSILGDFDLDLKNNYDNASFKNNYSAGLIHKGERNLFRFTRLYDREGNFIGRGYNPTYYEDAIRSGKFKSEDGRIIDISQIREYPHTSPGMPILVSLVLWPFKSSRFLEPAAILLTVYVSLIGFYFLYQLLVFFSKNKKVSIFLTLCFALGTPFWHYSTRFIKETYAIPLLLASFYFFFVKKKSFIPGLLMAAGLFVKHTFPVFIIPLVIYKISIKRFKEALIFCLPLIPAIGLFAITEVGWSFSLRYLPQIEILSLYAVLIYVLLKFSNIILAIKIRNIGFLVLFSLVIILIFWQPKAVLFIRNNIDYLFSPRFGLFTFAPFAIFSFLGIPKFFREYPREAVVILISALFYYVLYFYISNYDNPIGTLWWSNEIQWEWANRNLLIALPFLSLFLAYWFIYNKNRVLKFSFFILLAISIAINFEAAFANELVRTHNLWEMWYRSWVILGRLFS